MEDFTRNIQRKKEKELAELQLVGGDGSTSAQAGQRRAKGRPQRSVPLRQREEIQEVSRGLMREAEPPAALLPVLACGCHLARGPRPLSPHGPIHGDAHRPRHYGTSTA